MLCSRQQLLQLMIFIVLYVEPVEVLVMLPVLFNSLQYLQHTLLQKEKTLSLVVVH